MADRLKACFYYGCVLRCVARDRDADSVSISLAMQRHATQHSIPLARTERFKRSFVLYALRSFPTDISEDLCNDFIDI